MVNNGTLSTAAEIKARYVNANGKKIGALLSENITLQTNGGASRTETVPEPSTLLLLGAGLIGMSRFSPFARKAK